MLMFPEPDATGGGSEPVEEKQDAVEVSIFDFDAETPEDTEKEAADSNEETPENTEYALTLADDLGLDASEVSIFTKAAQKYGLDAEVASNFVQDVTRQISENTARVAKETDAADEKKLRADWGSNFDANMRKAAATIKRVGAAVGWSKEQMAAFKNADAFRVFYDISRAFGEGAAAGFRTGSAPVATPKLTQAQLKEEMAIAAKRFYAARREGNRTEAMKQSDRHYELLTQMMGSKAVRMFSM